jgi:Collagen triple helix repeat (20 copies)
VGTTGAMGPSGQAGVAGTPGATGSAGASGVAGPAGAAGLAGATGAEGECKPLAYTEFYALMPPDNAATVGAGIPVQFPRNGPSTGAMTRAGGSSSSEFVLPVVGTYQMSFSVSVNEPGQLELSLNSGSGMVELPYSVYGRATGTSLISGEALVTTTAANSVIEVRNPAGNTPALTITPAAGGAHAAVASLVVHQLG